jgi:DNA-binding response OmpR family regulator
VRYAQDDNIVLYVNENKSTRNLLSSILEQNGFVVLAASNPAEAIEYCHEIHFDIAILHYVMPDPQGEALPAEIKFVRPDVPIIMISAGAVITGYELAFVDAHFGAGTPLDDVVVNMRELLARRPGRRL